MGLDQLLGDGRVDVDDILWMAHAWHLDPPPDDADRDRDGDVDIEDLMAVAAAWGEACD